MNKPLLNGMLPTLLCLALVQPRTGLAADEHDHDHDEPAPATAAARDDHDDHDHDQTTGTADTHDHDDHADDKHDDHNDGDGHDDHDEGEHGHEEGVSLDAGQMRLADIRVAELTPRRLDYRVYAPGEIRANGYTSYLVSPRVDSVVVRRHAALGEHVHKGQPLVTLFSETMAEAQAAYRVSHAEWLRAQKLGRKTVGDKRYLSARTDNAAAYGRLKAFGLSDTAIKAIPQGTAVLGEYSLTAEIDGAVLSDDFQQGQRVEAGDALMILADERELWVEARLAPNSLLHLPAGTPAEIVIGDDTLPARVTQEAHTIDPETRTRVVRLLVDNSSHRLHPGMFADVFFNFSTTEPVLAVPESALMRNPDGDWTVFVEDHPGEFQGVEVELGRPLGRWREISGVEAGSRVVMEGAFFVASQIAKGGFDPHNH